MINVRIDRAVWILLLVSVGLYLSLPLLSFLGCKEKVEANEPNRGADVIYFEESKFKFVPYTVTPSTTLEWTEPYESEPNEPECKHEFVTTCAVGGCDNCLKCMDCGKDLLPKGSK